MNRQTMADLLRIRRDSFEALKTAGSILEREHGVFVMDSTDKLKLIGNGFTSEWNQEGLVSMEQVAGIEDTDRAMDSHWDIYNAWMEVYHGQQTD